MKRLNLRDILGMAFMVNRYYCRLDFLLLSYLDICDLTNIGVDDLDCIADQIFCEELFF